MFPDLNALLAPAVVERLVLLINHVLAAEPQAQQRLLPHTGKRLQLLVDGWPQWLPGMPPLGLRELSLRITPAGLLEWLPAAADRSTREDAGDGNAGGLSEAADLRVRVPAADAARMAAGVMFGRTNAALPPLEIDGDALLAADINWLAGNLRWDIAGDLERAFGPAVAHELQRVGSRFTQGLGAMLHSAGELAARWRSR